jgi:hypothetical protein
LKYEPKHRRDARKRQLRRYRGNFRQTQYAVVVRESATELSKPLEIFAERGLIAVTATVGKVSWQTSLMPYGNGTHFIALPAKVRKPNSIRLGDSVTVEFVRRDRKSGEDARMSK